MVWQIVEHSGAVPLLQNSLKRGMPNAYLIVGPAHVGKMTLAIDLAKALNCEAKEKPCGECAACQKIAAGKHADVQVICLPDAVSKESRVKEISVEQIKDIQHASSLPPFEGKFKVFIIDGAEQLSNEAANRLLKTLEEPAENVIYLLLTVNDELLLSTVISRCQRLDLLPLPAGEIEKYMTEKINVEADKAKLLSRLACGCMGWAVAAVEDETILTERAVKIGKIIEIADSNIEERFAYAGQLAAQFSQSRLTVYDELALWIDWWHDLLLIKSGSKDKIANIDLTARLNEVAAGYNLLRVRGFIGRLQAAVLQLKLNAAPRLVLEVLMLNIPGRDK